LFGQLIFKGNVSGADKKVGASQAKKDEQDQDSSAKIILVCLCHDNFSAALNLALSERGFKAVSGSLAVMGFLVKIFKLACLKVCFIIRSSSEW